MLRFLSDNLKNPLRHLKGDFGHDIFCQEVDHDIVSVADIRLSAIK